MAWTDGLSMRVELKVYEDGRMEAVATVIDATYAQAAGAIQACIAVDRIPLVLVFEGDMTAVHAYTQQYGIPILE